MPKCSYIHVKKKRNLSSQDKHTTENRIGSEKSESKWSGVKFSHIHFKHSLTFLPNLFNTFQFLFWEMLSVTNILILSLNKPIFIS